MSNILALNQVATNGDTACSWPSFTPSFDQMALVIMSAVSNAADFADVATDFPSITDDHNNVYQLMYSHINVADPISGNFLALAIYLCANPTQTFAGTITANIVSDLQPAGLQTSAVYGLTFLSSFNQYAFDVAAVSVGEAAQFTTAAGVVGSGLTDLMIAFGIDGALGNTGDMQFIASFAPAEIIDTHPGVTDGASMVLAYKNASGPPFLTGNMVSTINPHTATSANQFVVGIRASVAQGAAGKQLTFQISKGPEPKILPEGRALATVIIDGSQQQFSPIVTPPGLNYPEFSFFGQNVTDSWETFWVTEFDLEQVGPQGSRMSELRGLIARSRPFFGLDPNNNRSDNPGWNGTAGFYAVAFLTNLTTLQTVVLGGHALFDNDSLDTGQAMSETIHRAIPANAGGMKFRFLVLCNDTRPDGYGIGKWILNFTNFDLPSDSVVSEAIGVGRYV